MVRWSRQIGISEEAAHEEKYNSNLIYDDCIGAVTYDCANRLRQNPEDSNWVICKYDSGNVADGIDGL